MTNPKKTNSKITRIHPELFPEEKLFAPHDKENDNPPDIVQADDEFEEVDESDLGPPGPIRREVVSTNESKRADIFMFEVMAQTPPRGKPRLYRDGTNNAAIIQLCAEPEKHGFGTGGDSHERRHAREARELQYRLAETFTLGGPSTRHGIDEIAATLFERAPHLAAAIEALRESALLAMSRGAFWLQSVPILIVGEPGCGKSDLIERYAKLANLPVLYLDASSLTTTTALISADSVFSSSRPSELLRALADSRVANLLVIVDELDKLRDVSRGGSDTPTEALIGLLSKASASRHMDSFLQAEIDLSHLNWILLANDISRIAAPLRDRCKIIRVEQPDADAMAQIVAKEVVTRGLEPELAAALFEAYEAGRIRSLRKLHKALDAAAATKSRPRFN
ncbi:MAG: AAA family ATPase [Candidatus Devosia phytovorans]|uniref:AAA family ATPase n=1 Tax=Candidatus Devosia phytovorans TaxID=3121372 RepID=A0AAJ5VRI2_9HYPH|nr:AAA family ATPase [Devosia sp.]WEK03448.1 MAG: AAA family ATPase [Devosia sp.]